MARQGDLFRSTSELCPDGFGMPELALSAQLLRSWQERLAQFQAPLFRGDPASQGQTSLFLPEANGPGALAARINPLSLQPQPLSFWRWTASAQKGAAVYFVLDRPPGLPQPLLLYVGETGRADQRWKGEHDCKRYLASYGEALAKVGMEGRPSIRFWLDVPRDLRPRRELEQALIRRWQPPFNKETRDRWTTPFTAANETP
ncbi:MAG: GIY-YIG nuclease family protein [Cyanobacteriota bacterium]|nr:GIY-YIG nuclease family protein [Cyanobacteriota bacterium]